MLLSVGYAACHWCHVMAHESFEDAATAALVNEHFVAIKVDREERPDVDAVYMAATQAMTGQGGWPMTVFLTPDGRAVLLRHLLPARPVRPALVTAVGERLARTSGDVTGRAERIAAALAERRRGPVAGWAARPGELDLAEVTDAAVAGAGRGASTRRTAGSAARRSSRRRWRCEFLLRHHERTGERARRWRWPRRTCEAMARGGIYDQLGGGFARYSVDAQLDGAALREDALRQRPAAPGLHPPVAACTG